MTGRYQAVAASIVLSLGLLGCSDRDAKSASTDSARPDAATDKWLGQWNGPEGTFIRIEGGKGRYEVTVQNLDGPQTYHGSTAGELIQFERNGVTESIRATNGAETGMKWLADKSNCLTVRPGEGYCRE